MTCTHWLINSHSYFWKTTLFKRQKTYFEENCVIEARNSQSKILGEIILNVNTKYDVEGHSRVVKFQDTKLNYTLIPNNNKK